MAKRKVPLGNKLARLRKAKGWTMYEACKETRSVKRESLLRMETGRTDPEKVLVGTAIQLIELYHPNLELEDFRNGEKDD